MKQPSASEDGASHDQDMHRGRLLELSSQVFITVSVGV